MTRGLRLYVWRNVFYDYTPGIAFALAKSPDHARELIAVGLSGVGLEAVKRELAGEPEVYDRPYGDAIYGGG